MKTYEVKRVVTLKVYAKDRKEAIKRSKGWEGETFGLSSEGWNVEWSGVSRFLSAKSQ